MGGCGVVGSVCGPGEGAGSGVGSVTGYGSGVMGSRGGTTGDGAGGSTNGSLGCESDILLDSKAALPGYPADLHRKVLIDGGLAVEHFA